MILGFVLQGLLTVSKVTKFIYSPDQVPETKQKKQEMKRKSKGQR